MTTTNDSRLAGWSGIVFSLLSLIVIPLTASPLPVLGAAGADYARWYTAHRNGFLVGNFLGLAAFLPGLVQLVVLAAAIRRREGDGGWLSTLVLSSGVFTYAIFFCSLVVFEALPFLLATRSIDSLEAMGTLGNVWFAVDGLAAVPLVVAISWAARRTGVLPSWFVAFGWVVALLASIMGLGGITASPAWLAGGGAATFAGFTAFFIWTLALGVIQLRQRPSA
jgi:hypothetical protein